MRKFFSKFYLIFVFVFLYAPIVTMMVLSFNESKSRAHWGGFSLKWYKEMFANENIMQALLNTLEIALISSLAATVIGVIACIGINALSKGPKSIMMGMNNIPLLNADIVTGLSLMLTYVFFGVSLGLNTILIAHITFNVPYVILSVMPKLKQTSRSTYEAAMDLGAGPIKAFFAVVFPELVPGILSGFLLAFSMSIDDFIITYFNKGAGVNTISTMIYSQVRRGIVPTMYALSTLLFVSVMGILLFINFAPKLKDKGAAASKK